MNRSFVAALLGAAVCVPTWAITLQASVALDNFSVQVTDLRPDDGADPWFLPSQRIYVDTQSGATNGAQSNVDLVRKWRQDTRETLIYSGQPRWSEPVVVGTIEA